MILDNLSDAAAVEMAVQNDDVQQKFPEPCAMESGSGWESNPPGTVSDTSPVLKTGAVTRPANASGCPPTGGRVDSGRLSEDDLVVPEARSLDTWRSSNEGCFGNRWLLSDDGNG